MNDGCENLIKCIDYGTISPYFYALSEYFDKGTLRMFLFRSKKSRVAVNEKIFISICAEVTKALFALQNLDSPHGDVSPQNIFFHSDNKIHLGDHGINSHFQLSDNKPISSGLPHYCAPEIIMQNSDFTLQSDIFSLGCVLYECCTLQPLFPDYFSVIQYCNNKKKPEIHIENEMLNEVIMQCLEVNPEKRCSADDILDLDIIKKYFQEKINPQPTDIYYDKSEYVFTVGEDVPRSITPKINVSSVDNYTIEPELPNGLLFDQSNGTISGQPVSPMKACQYKISVFKNGEGCNTTITISIISIFLLYNSI